MLRLLVLAIGDVRRKTLLQRCGGLSPVFSAALSPCSNPRNDAEGDAAHEEQAGDSISSGGSCVPVTRYPALFLS